MMGMNIEKLFNLEQDRKTTGINRRKWNLMFRFISGAILVDATTNRLWKVKDKQRDLIIPKEHLDAW